MPAEANLSCNADVNLRKIEKTKLPPSCKKSPIPLTSTSCMFQLVTYKKEILQ